MTNLDDAILALLTHRPETAKDLVTELRHWTEGGVSKGPPWQPGDVLNSLDKLILTGKSVHSPEGYRLAPPRVANNQRSMFT